MTFIKGEVTETICIFQFKQISMYLYIVLLHTNNTTINWISSHWHETTTSQIFWSNKLISQQWHHPIVSSSARNLGFIFDSDQINSVFKSCHLIFTFNFHIRDIRRIRHLLPSTATALANSLVSSKLGLLQFTILCHLTSKSQQTSKHSKFIGTCHYIHFKISTHHTNTQKTTLASNQTKNRLQTLPSHIQNINKSTTYISSQLSSISITFCFYTIFWFTCSFHSICPIITWKKGFLCHRSTTLEFTPFWYPKFAFSTKILFQVQKHTSSKLLFLPRLFPIFVYPDFDSCYSHFMPYRITPTIEW